MKQYDVCPAAGHGLNVGTGSPASRRYVVVLQHRVLSDLETVVVAPLFPAGQLPPIRNLRPAISIERRDYLVAIDRLASLPKRQLRAPVASMDAMDYDLRKALDLVFAGF